MGRVRPEAAPARSVVTSFAPPTSLVADAVLLSRVPSVVEPTRGFLASFAFFPASVVQPPFATRMHAASVHGFATVLFGVVVLLGIVTAVPALFRMAIRVLFASFAKLSFQVNEIY